MKHFARQEGYAAFSVSATARPTVRQYIEHQEQHHQARSFREELVEMLERAGIDFDPRFLDGLCCDPAGVATYRILHQVPGVRDDAAPGSWR